MRIRDVVRGATAMLALLAVGAGVWKGFEQWRAGEIELVTEGPPLAVQVLHANSETRIGEPIDLVQRAVLTLPDGEYRLRVNGKGRVGRTYRFAVNRGERQLHTISLDEGRLLGGEPAPRRPLEKLDGHAPIQFATVTAALEFERGKVDFVQWSDGSLVRRAGSSGKVIWDAFHPETAYPRKRDPAQWFPSKSPDDQPGELMQTARDLDGDGTSDMIWYFRGKALFLALSGKDGSLLWHQIPELNGPPAGGQPTTRSSARESVIAGKPAMLDADHDGTPDILATVLFGELPEETKRRVAEAADETNKNQDVFYRREVVALSGRSGARLWSYAIDKEYVQNRGELLQSKPLPAVVQSGKRELIAVLDDEKWLGLDPANGKVRAGPIDVGFSPIRMVPHADLDGDGEPEVMTLGYDSGGVLQNTLFAYSLKTRKQLWAADIGNAYQVGDIEAFERRFKRRPVFPNCLLTSDLDGDGRLEVVVPDTAKLPPLAGSRGLRVLDGATGKTRWQRPMRAETTAEDGIAHIIPAPDLDGDGTREVITVSRYDGRNSPTFWPEMPEEPERVYVDAFSGKDGKPLWWWSADLTFERFTRIAPPMWWGRGPDGWPLLALQLGGEDRDDPDPFARRYEVVEPIVHVLEASTGREQHTVRGLNAAEVADLTGDGIPDLWGEAGGELRAYRGEAPEVWRALGQFNPAAAGERSRGTSGGSAVDFDRDSVADTLVTELTAPGKMAHRFTGSRVVVARSGRDGHVIWKTALDPRGSWFEPRIGEQFAISPFAPREGDLDGDGVGDVVVRKLMGRIVAPSMTDATVAFEALSGRTGARLWSATVPTLEVMLFSEKADWIEPRVIEPGGAPDLIVRRDRPGGGKLSRLSGRDGRTIWEISLSNQTPFMNNDTRLHFYDDLDGDGALDCLLVVPQATSDGHTNFTLDAITLRGGKKLWSQALRFENRLMLLGDLRVGDLDGDGRPEAVALEASPEDGKKEVCVRVFDARDGKERWMWKSGFVPNDTPGGQSIALANLDGNATRQVCVSFQSRRLFGISRQVVVLDGSTSKVRARREINEPTRSGLVALDCNGDGRDELLVLDGDLSEGRLCVLDKELKDLWTSPPRTIKSKPDFLDMHEMSMLIQRSRTIDRFIPSAGGRPGEIILSPAMAIEVTTGRPIWTGQPPLVTSASLDLSAAAFAPRLLDAGDSGRQPLLIGTGLGATVCREALPTTAEGSITAPKGRTWVPRSSGPADPRWARPLPWRAWLKGLFGPTAFLVAGGLALVNVVLPLVVLRLLIGRRRAFRMWALMVLPIAAVVPVMVYLNVSPWLPVGEPKWLATQQRVFLAGTLAGIPVVLGAWWLIAALVRGRWRQIATMCGLLVVATLVAARLWIWLERKSVAPIEHYGWEGWELVLMVGAYVSAVAWAIGLVVFAAYKVVQRWRRLSLG